MTYYQDGKALEDAVTVSAYNTLTLLEPKREVVLAVGSSINLVYAGGPRPILGRMADHQRVIVSEDKNIATAVDVTQFYKLPSEDYSVIEVLCRKLGETDIKLMITNTPTISNCKPHTSSVVTRVVCGKPRKITLQPEFKIADIHACPMDLSSGNVVVQSSKNIDLDVIVYDDNGNKFLNFSSFKLEWMLMPMSGGLLLNKDGIFPRNYTVGNVPISYKSYQTLTPSLDIGNLELNVTVRGYRPNVMKKYGIKHEFPEFMGEEDQGKDLSLITATLNLYLVGGTEISPNIITVFNHPGNKVVIPVKQGSGYFELALSADDIAMIKYTESAREIEVTPLKSGELIVQLSDLCLVSKPAQLTVNVVSVGIIRVEMVDKVETGKCIPAIVRLYDENDNLMIIPEPGMIDLRPEFENKIANIQRSEENPANPWGVGEIHYTITGKYYFNVIYFLNTIYSFSGVYFYPY